MRLRSWKQLLFLVSFLLLSVSTVFSVPARRGIFQTIVLSDGTHVSVELFGDEKVHWWQSEEGEWYVADASGKWQKTTPVEMALRARQRAAARQRIAAKQSSDARELPFRTLGHSAPAFVGTKRALIILVEFADLKFDQSTFGNTRTLFNRIANEQGYSEHGFKGSVSDYFKEQSGGVFNLVFDVAGPVTLSHGYSYYGQNDADGVDMYAFDMVREACKAVNDSVDFSDYDWNHDGEIEEVFVVFAGKGENDAKDSNYIWPHMDHLSYDSTGAITLDGVKIDTYACASELGYRGRLSGIGIFCHEFSHCMGFPDMYDTSSGGTNFGMGSWDLMARGCYNGDEFTPAGYSGYEKMVCGWTQPVELDSDTDVTDMKPLSEGGQTYIVYNKGNRNEYYILENRQRKHFDKALPGAGLLIEHIDYDKDIWYWNVVNSTRGEYYVGASQVPSYNDHECVSLFHADNQKSDYHVAYPYKDLDSLTDSSLPAAALWNANTDSTYLMHVAIENIKQNADSTMAFSFVLKTAAGQDEKQNGILFRETFDQCKGTGGNDGRFSGIIASSLFNPDNNGWDMGAPFVGDCRYGASQCARFGKGNQTSSGYVLSPTFTLPSDTVTLTFRAACWNASADGTNLVVGLQKSDATLIDSRHLTMKRGEWTTYSLRIKGSGRCRIAFIPDRRFFLDDVVVKWKANKSTGTDIRHTEVVTPSGRQAIYSLDGRRVGDDLQRLSSGSIYIVGGKKVLK